MKLREKKSCAIHEWSLFFSFSLWGGYGLVGQPRAPPKEENGGRKKAIDSWATNHSTFFSSSTKSNFFDLCWMKRRLVEWRQINPRGCAAQRNSPAIQHQSTLFFISSIIEEIEKKRSWIDWLNLLLFHWWASKAINERQVAQQANQFHWFVGCSGWRSLIDCGAGAASINQLTSPALAPFKDWMWLLDWRDERQPQSNKPFNSFHFVNWTWRDSLATREVDAGMNGGQLGRKPITNNAKKRKVYFSLSQRQLR